MLTEIAFHVREPDVFRDVGVELLQIFLEVFLGSVPETSNG